MTQASVGKKEEKGNTGKRKKNERRKIYDHWFLNKVI